MESQQQSGRRKWLSHVKKTMRANKGKSLKQVLKLAKKTYTKAKKGGAEPYEAPSTASPLSGGRRGGKTRKNKKGSRKH